MMYPDGRERPESYDGNALTRAIEEYFAKARDAELVRLRAENAALRTGLAESAATASS